MKKMISVVMAGCLAVSLAACGGSSAESTAASTSSEASSEAVETVTLTGEAEGFGGTITATVVKTGDTITSVTFEGPDETPNVGGVALEPMAEKIVEANGVDVDTESGATVSSEACIAAVEAALASEAEG